MGMLEEEEEEGGGGGATGQTSCLVAKLAVEFLNPQV